MQLSNQVYDISKWFVLVFLPALAVLIAGLGELFALPNLSPVVTAINLITVFLGSIMQISSQHYHDQRGPGAGGGATLA